MEIRYYILTVLIIVVTVLVSMKAFNAADYKYKMMLYPFKMKDKKEQYRVFSHALIHADYLHLFFNMFVLFSFGRLVEISLKIAYGEMMGLLYFFLLYVLGIVSAALWPMYRNANNSNYMSLGASGAVSAVLFAAILIRPDGGIYLFFIPFEIKAWLFGILYLGFEYYMSKRSEGSGIAHDAHFGGAVFGIAFMLILDFKYGINFVNYILQ